MKVKIVKCDHDYYWYYHKIGNVYDVREKDEDNYEVLGCTWTIYKEDCEIIQDIIPVPKKSEVHELEGVHTITSTVPLASYSISDLMTWRNSASKRITKADQDLKYLEGVVRDSIRKFHKIAKKREKDATWVVKLNKILYRKVIKDRA